MEEDINLIEKYLAGDAEAIEELVMKYQRHIYAFLYRMTNDMEGAKDLTQKTFLKAIKGINGFRREASFKTWLYQIAMNTGLNHITQKRHEEVELEESIMDPELDSGQTGALSAIIEKEKRNRIKKGIEELPERQRLAIVLRVYDGLSCSETARVMGCSEGAVKAHYHNGVKRLREVCKGEGL
ncbi:MAG: sigma-70 family RNA polymerase sigma factor [Nitrospirae bacterium]|nr:sigma-70 family RNA polymerase sigma factor [Nitrospirota bacterium]